jgi:hypothetical protein
VRARRGHLDCGGHHDQRTTNSNKAIALLQRPEGVTLAEFQEALGGWQPHSVHGFISILGSEAGLKIESFKDENKVKE